MHVPHPSNNGKLPVIIIIVGPHRALHYECTWCGLQNGMGPTSGRARYLGLTPRQQARVLEDSKLIFLQKYPGSMPENNVVQQ